MRAFLMVFFIALCMLSNTASAQAPTPAPAPVPKDSTSSSWFSMNDSALYKGKYKVEGVPFDYVEVVVKEGKLYFFAGGYEGNLDPVKEKKDAFDALGQAVFTFGRNTDGTDVETLRIDYNGMVIDGKKEKPAN